MSDRMTRSKPGRRLLRKMTVIALLGLGIGPLTPSSVRAEDPAGLAVRFHDVRQQTREFLDYNRSITLSAEQRAVMQQALSGLPAPCCADRTAATCCCPCNMAQSWWGLSKHLIAERGFNADQVRGAVAEWIDFINPDGFTGDACYAGRCSRPFHENGCGGM